METQQQQQQQQQQYQNQAQIDPNQTTQPYDPSSYASQMQAYNPSSYYATYPQHYDTTTQQQYQQQTYQTNPDSSATTYTASSYYYSHYSTTSYDPNSIHPPGVPASADTQQIPPPISDYYYQAPQTHAYFQPGQPVYGAVGSQGGRSSRRGGRGSFGRGRGRGGGCGKNVSAQTTNTADASYVQEQAAPSKPAPQMAWCELCRVDCNTLEILEKHKNGKRHLRNLKVFEEMQNLSQQHLTVQNQPEGIAEAQMSDMADKTVQPSEEAVIQDFSGGRGGLKRKMRGGRGGAKWFRTPDGIRRLVDPPKPKPMVHFFCELCNVKCESRVIYESHLAGKKHLSSVKRYEGHKVVFGEAVESLYPTIPNLPPTIISQANQQVQGPQDAQTLASLMLSNQNLPDPEAAQAALAQLLTQHGVHDAQTLLTQLIPYLLTQSQEPGSEPLPEAGLETNATYLQSEGPHVSTEVAGQSEGQNGEVTAEQQYLSGNDGSEAAVGPSDKRDDGSSEAKV